MLENALVQFFADTVLWLLLFLPLLWRIYRRAGFNPALSLTAAIPIVGGLVVAAILAFRDWPAAKDSQNAAC